MNRRNRLRRSSDISRVRSRGEKIVTRPLVFFVAPGQSGAPRVAVPVSRRFGSAVCRNRLRRRVREALRCQLPNLPEALDIVALPRQRAAFAAPKELTAAVARGIRQSKVRLAE
jgi:ribonuclease P protein component